MAMDCSATPISALTRQALITLDNLADVLHVRDLRVAL
jgi:hypothetical protein